MVNVYWDKHVRVEEEEPCCLQFLCVADYAVAGNVVGLATCVAEEEADSSVVEGCVELTEH